MTSPLPEPERSPRKRGRPPGPSYTQPPLRRIEPKPPELVVLQQREEAQAEKREEEAQAKEREDAEAWETGEREFTEAWETGKLKKMDRRLKRVEQQMQQQMEQPGPFLQSVLDSGALAYSETWPSGKRRHSAAPPLHIAMRPHIEGWHSHNMGTQGHSPRLSTSTEQLAAGKPLHEIHHAQLQQSNTSRTVDPERVAAVYWNTTRPRAEQRADAQAQAEHEGPSR